jgi:hypothetical protein
MLMRAHILKESKYHRPNTSTDHIIQIGSRTLNMKRKKSLSSPFQLDIHTISRVREITVQKMADGASLKETRASPKSHIFNLQSAFAKIFFGFKSR